MKQETICI